MAPEKHAKGSEAINVAEFRLSLGSIPLAIDREFRRRAPREKQVALTDTNSIVSLSHFFIWRIDLETICREFFSEYDDYHSPSPQYFEKSLPSEANAFHASYISPEGSIVCVYDLFSV
uniref:Uncharacterized protein n=1 Tax=Ditylenchus dipsaci TaxID=166011 RepID=A0A915CUQ4_9BILA